MTWFPAKARKAFLWGSSVGACFYLTNRVALDSAILPETATDIFQGVTRSSRAMITIAKIIADYKYSLHEFPEDSEDYGRRLSQIHLRSALRIRNLCESNKGFYVKAGQFVAAMQQVPKEYSSTLSSLQDQVVPCDFEAVKEVLENNFGQQWSEKFFSFDEQPIAAASIAQVHRAKLKNHQEVAVKVQFPGLDQQMRMDTMTMSFLSNTISKIFPDYRFGWLVLQFMKSVSAELDFIQEARNCERTGENFKKNELVRVPQIYWDLTTSKVLTMQYCEGCKVDDVKFLRERGIHPRKVAKLMLEVFSEMIFVHGFVHGDPHPGNLLVAPNGTHGFHLVLLDHGIYRNLDEGFRKSYCELWKAMLLLDSHKIMQIGERFGVGKYAKFFPVIFTGRTLESKATLGGAMSAEEKQNLKQELKSLKSEDISTFVESLPPEFLSLLRTDGLLRSISSTLGASRQDRLIPYAKYALLGLRHTSISSFDVGIPITLGQWKATLSNLQLQFLVEMVEIVWRMEAVMQFFWKLCGWIASLTTRNTT